MQEDTDTQYKEMRKPIYDINENFNKEEEIIKKNKTKFRAENFHQ